MYCITIGFVTRDSPRSTRYSPSSPRGTPRSRGDGLLTRHFTTKWHEVLALKQHIPKLIRPNVLSVTFALITEMTCRPFSPNGFHILIEQTSSAGSLQMSPVDYGSAVEQYTINMAARSKKHTINIMAARSKKHDKYGNGAVEQHTINMAAARSNNTG